MDVSTVPAAGLESVRPISAQPERETSAEATPAVATRAVVAKIKQAGDRPACVGVGVSTADQVLEVNSYADGAIVGTAFIKAYEEGGITALTNKVRDLASGLD